MFFSFSDKSDEKFETRVVHAVGMGESPRTKL